MNKLKTVKWGFIGCGEVTEKKSGPAFAMIEGSQVVDVSRIIRQKTQYPTLVYRRTTTHW